MHVHKVQLYTRPQQPSHGGAIPMPQEVARCKLIHAQLISSSGLGQETTREDAWYSILGPRRGYGRPHAVPRGLSVRLALWVCG